MMTGGCAPFDGKPADHFHASAAGHVVIDNEKIVDGHLLHHEPFFSVRCDIDRKSPPLEILLQQAREAGIIFHAENTGWDRTGHFFFTPFRVPEAETAEFVRSRTIFDHSIAENRNCPGQNRLSSENARNSKKKIESR
jgi:hypothetical protein